MLLELYSGHVLSEMGKLRLYHRAELDPQVLLEAIKGGGEVLKTSSKTETRRVGEWVIKRSRLEKGLGPVKRTLARGRYRRAWIAGNFLHAHGVRVPEPLAYGEWTLSKLVTGNVMVTRFLSDCINVEKYAAQLVRDSASQETVDAFFTDMAFDINRFTSAGAYHADLSGKNIFTKDGTEFCFIDLDSVVLGKRYTDALRLKNHVQLYDSFCDFCSHDTLTRFIGRLLPPGAQLNAWLQSVEHGQKMRRQQHRDRQRR